MSEYANAAASPGPAGAVDLDQLKAFLTSSIFIVPYISWQAWVLGTSFRQRRGRLDLTAKSPASTPAAAAPTRETGPDAAAHDASSPASLTPPPTPQASRLRPLIFVVGTSSLFLSTQAWLRRVLTHVPEPYLDEIFHIPQAQKYCQGRWYEWDDKITTPPGLYLFSVLYQPFWSAVDGDSIWALRGANTIAIMLVAIVACSCRAEMEQQQKAQETQNQQQKKKSAFASGIFSLYAFHSALNIALFPVLFFFSALYYTDIYSALVTLLAYRNHLHRCQCAAASPTALPPVWTSWATVLLGLAALVMRQTNIFWVVVYMGGLEAVHAVKQLRRTAGDAWAETEYTPVPFASASAMTRYYVGRYALGDIHDPAVGESWPDDWVLSLTSIAMAALCHPLRILARVWPYVLVLASFAGFVAWNGGVVLGDKSNHVATLHLAQMLYIWPLFAFFSAPLFVTHAGVYLGRLYGLVRRGRAESESESEKGPEPASSSNAIPVTATTLRLLYSVFATKAYYLVYLALCLDAALAIVYYNTIVHPFTLADNRHYMFYIFRYTIRRPGLARFGLVPVYAACSWACWRVLSGPASGTTTPTGWACSPFAPPRLPRESPRPLAEQDKEKEPEREKKHQKQQQKTAKSGRKGARLAAQGEARESQTGQDSRADDAPEPGLFLSLLHEEPAAAAAQAAPATSTALLWLLASALSLVTAPLVEPRYFILPWVFWRLLVPAVPTVPAEPPKTGSSTSSSEATPPQSVFVRLAQRLDVRLTLETLWFGAVNVATMYIFLFRPYVWRDEAGQVLDQGRLQRFMW